MKEKELIYLLDQFLGDSRKLSEEAGEKIIEICKERFKEIYEVYKKNSFPDSWYSDYSPGHGQFSIDLNYNEDAIERREVSLEYEDSWGYGGYAECFMDLKFDQLEDSYLETLDKSLRGLRIASVKENIERIEKSLEREKKLLAELIGE